MGEKRDCDMDCASGMTCTAVSARDGGLRRLGRERAGLSASDRFQTSVRPVSDQCQTSVMPDAQSMSQSLFSPIHSADATMSCRMHRSVMSDAQCRFGCTGVLTEIHDSGPKVVQCWYGNWSIDV